MNEEKLEKPIKYTRQHPEAKPESREELETEDVPSKKLEKLEKKEQQEPLPKRKIIFMTGVTGFVGSHLATELLRHGNELVALARPSRGKSAEERVNEAITKTLASPEEFENLHYSIRVIEGDVTQNNLGIKEEERVTVGDIDEVLHCAANLSFKEEDREKVIQSNVEGTKNVLDFAKSKEVNRLNFMSTAYVSGRKQGSIQEDLIPESQKPQFNNPYEESKYLAEHTIHNWSSENSIPATILRPSTVVKKGETDNGSGYYGFANAFTFFRQQIILTPEKIQFPCNQDAYLDLISVDDIAKYTSQIVNSERNTEDFEIFHVTNPNSITLGEIFKDSFDLVGIGNKVDLVNDETRTNPDFYKDRSVNKRIVETLQDLLPYLFLETLFDTEKITNRLEGEYNPERINREFLHEVLKYKYTPDAEDSRIRELERRRFIQLIPAEFVTEGGKAGAIEQRVITATSKGVEAIINLKLRPSGITDTQELYTKEAERYDRKHRWTTANNDNVLRREAAQEIINYIKSGPESESIKILDIATGTGLTLEEIAEATSYLGEKVSLYGIDFTDRMLQVGNERIRKEGKHEHIQLNKGDAGNFVDRQEGVKDGLYHFEPNSIDFITTVFGIGGIEDTDTCFEQQLRALKEEGIAIMIDIHSPSLKREDIKMPLRLPASPAFVKQAWEKVTKPIALSKL